MAKITDIELQAAHDHHYAQLALIKVFCTFIEHLDTQQKLVMVKSLAGGLGQKLRKDQVILGNFKQSIGELPWAELQKQLGVRNLEMVQGLELWICVEKKA